MADNWNNQDMQKQINSNMVGRVKNLVKSLAFNLYL